MKIIHRGKTSLPAMHDGFGGMPHERVFPVWLIFTAEDYVK